MISSMTAFARKSTQQPWGQAIWELRSVNHRYLDLSLKLPESFREWESDFRHLISGHLQRGKVECYLTFVPDNKTAPQLQINANLVDQLLQNCQQLGQHPAIKPGVKALELLKWPGVIVMQNADLSTLKQPLTDLLQEALVSLNQARQREGQQIQEFLQEKLQKVNTQVAIVKEKMPQCLVAQKQKLQSRLSDLTENMDRDRLEQELVYYAQRMDVEEELARLASHVKEVTRVIKDKGAVGRRLDFLMQEFNREANTLGSKSLDETVTAASVELKVLIEQMREQIQNIE